MLPFLILLFLNPLISAAQDPKPITAKPGDNVILPCQARNSNNLAGVEWSRRDLEPEYVLLLRDGHIVPEDQQPSFKDRVELQDQQMKNGDVSLILEKVTAADDGTYECRILTHGGERRKRAVETISVINLHVGTPVSQNPAFKNRVDLKMNDGNVTLTLKDVTTADSGTYECRILTNRKKRAVQPVRTLYLSVVDPPGHTGGHTEDGGKEDGGGKIGSVESAAILSVFAVLLVSAVVVVGFLIYRKHKQQKSQESYQPPPEQQPV